jgi:hypothetical protein
MLLMILAGRSFAASHAEKEVRARVESLLAQMTLEEKIAQLAQIGGLALMPGAPKPEELIRKGQGGAVLWV